MPTPKKIRLSESRDMLQLDYPDGTQHQLSAEYLRVHSPSAEVRGHGPGQEVLQHGKQDVRIVNLQKSGHYALQIVFSDGHDSGIYTWDYLYDLGVNQSHYWQLYLQKLHSAGKARDNGVQVVKLVDPGKPD